MWSENGLKMVEHIILCWSAVGLQILKMSGKDAGLVVEIAPFGGECSQNEIDRLRGIAETAQCGAILGIGEKTRRTRQH